MNKYAIYTYHFMDAPLEGDCFQGEQVTRPDSSDDHRRAMVDHLFGVRNTLVTMKRFNKSDADDYPCTVLSHPDRFVLLRIENPKEVKIYEKHESQHGEAARIDERTLPSNPYVFVIFDCREGCGSKIAISVDSSAWRRTDKVAALVEESVNRQLQSLSCGFAIKIKPELMQLDFVSHSRNLIKKQRLSVKKMTIYFTRGMINPKVEEIVKGDNFIKGLLQRMYMAQHGELTLYGPEGQRIVDGRSRTFAHLVTLVGSDPQSEPFRLSMSYSDGSTYSCGKDIRMEFLLDDLTFASMMGECSLFPEHEIGAWFDGVIKEIEEQRNAEHSKKRRTPPSERLLFEGQSA